MEKKNQNKITPDTGTLSESSLREIKVWKNVSLDAFLSITIQEIYELRAFCRPPAMCLLVLKLHISIFFPDEVQKQGEKFWKEEQWETWLIICCNGNGYLNKQPGFIRLQPTNITMTGQAYGDILNWLKQEGNENVLDQDKVARISSFMHKLTIVHDCVLKILLIFLSV